MLDPHPHDPFIATSAHHRMDGMDGTPHEEQVAAVEFDPDQIVCPKCVEPFERDAYHHDLLDVDHPPAADPETVQGVLGVEPDDDDGGDPSIA